MTSSTTLVPAQSLGPDVAALDVGDGVEAAAVERRRGGAGDL